MQANGWLALLITKVKTHCVCVVSQKYYSWLSLVPKGKLSRSAVAFQLFIGAACATLRLLAIDGGELPSFPAL
jgi:hypothetical protein